MALSAVGVAETVGLSLVSGGILGVGGPQIAAGVGAGVCFWTQTLQAVTADTGSLGAGAGILPCGIPLALLLEGLFSGFASTGIAGQMAPLFAQGLANGLATAFLTQATITTTHPTVGVGVGVVSFPGPSAVPSMLLGFEGAGITGTSAAQLATAIGLGLDIGFAAYTPAIPIVGATSGGPSGGAGTGKII